MPKQKKLCIDWQPHEAELQNLYLVQDLPLERLMRHMEETHGFRATKAQYETQLKKWNIRKNLTNEEWNYALVKVQKRKLDGKESDVYLNGRVVPVKRVKKEMSRHFTLTQEQLFDTVSIPSTPEAIIVSTPHATVPTATGNIILHNLPYFQFQALLESTALFPKSPAQTHLVGATRQIALNSQTVNLPSLRSRDSHEGDALAFSQAILSPSHSASNEEGQMLLVRVFGPSVNADGHGPLSQIRSRMLVSSLERYDGELLEKSQLLCGPSKQSSMLQTLELALYYLSNNLLSEVKTDDFVQWIIKQQQNGALASFLKMQTPTVHACATKILESVLRIEDADFLELLIGSGIDIRPLKGISGGRHLVDAASRGNMRIAQILLKNGADVNGAHWSILSPLGGSCTALQSATWMGLADMVQVLLKAGAKVDALSPLDDCNTALSVAVYHGNVELVRILLTAGANIDICEIADEPAIGHSTFNSKNDELHQILVSASRKDYCSMTRHGVLKAATTGTQALSKYLAEKGKTGALVQEVLESALESACEDLDHNTVISLLDIGVGPDHWRPYTIGGGPLRNAVSRGDFELIEILLQAGAGVNRPGILSSAIEHDQDCDQGIKMLQFLLEKGADIKTEEGEETLRYAVECRCFEAVQFLVLSGVNVNNPIGDFCHTVLQDAVIFGEIGLVKILLDAGADVNALNHGGQSSALSIAVSSVADSGPEGLEMVQVLLAAGADVNIPKSILPTAIVKGDEKRVSILLKEGADVNSSPIGEYGASPVQAAARTGNLSLIKLLLELGADINAPAGYHCGRTAIQAASSLGLPSMELIEFLLDAGANINAPAGDHNGRTAIQAASSLEPPSVELIDFLLKAGANINAPAGECYGRTAIQVASCLELPTMELIDFLLDAGAEINAPAGRVGGVTALQAAAIRGHMRIALKYLEAGADVNAAAAIEDGLTALDGAAACGRLDMVQMLLNAGACGDSTKSHRFEEAIELARKYGHFAIAELLERA